MFKLAFISLAVAISACAVAADSDPASVIDLRASNALEELQRTNPAHFKKIQKVIAGLREQPARAEGNWLQVTVDARNVDLSRYIIRTSYPPKQLLQFTLDDMQYIMHGVRDDLTGEVQPVR